MPVKVNWGHMKQKLYHRERYLERLRPFYHDDDIIKVITGVRREYAPFGKIRDGWPRYLFTLDSLRNQRDGVRHLNLMEFLKGDGDLL